MKGLKTVQQWVHENGNNPIKNNKLNNYKIVPKLKVKFLFTYFLNRLKGPKKQEKNVFQKKKETINTNKFNSTSNLIKCHITIMTSTYIFTL